MAGQADSKTARKDSRRTPLSHWGWAVESDGLSIEGHSLVALAARHSTPFFLSVSSRVRNNAARIRATLGANESAFYALKTNGFEPSAKIIASEGLGVEVISSRELHSALALGFAPGRIIFNGPGKSDDELKLALTHGCMVQVESASEARTLARLAAEQGVTARGRGTSESRHRRRWRPRRRPHGRPRQHFRARPRRR